MEGKGQLFLKKRRTTGEICQKEFDARVKLKKISEILPTAQTANSLFIIHYYDEDMGGFNLLLHPSIKK